MIAVVKKPVTFAKEKKTSYMSKETKEGGNLNLRDPTSYLFALES